MGELSIFKANDNLAERMHNENSHEFRSKFERDRDRILYSKAFRRLSGKTQIFVTGEDDHIRTRLTHTLEVAQIALTISKQLNLNLPLTEAIAYGHDLGHTPFGHIGERTLNYIMNGCYSIKNINDSMKENQSGFKHNWQSLRVVSELELLNRDYFGLNLTDYTSWGILNHSKQHYKSCKRKNSNDKCNLRLRKKECSFVEDDSDFKLDFYSRYKKLHHSKSWSIEGLVVKIADEIAQRHHDIEDGIEANIIDKEELISKFNKAFGDFLTDDEKGFISAIEKEDESEYFIPMLSKLIVNFLTTQLIDNTKVQLRKMISKYDLKDENDFYHKKEEILNNEKIFNVVNFETDLIERDKMFQEYLYNRILNSYTTQRMDGKASYIIRQLFKAYISNPQQLPNSTIDKLFQRLANKEYENIKEKSDSKTIMIGILRNKLEELHFRNTTEDYKMLLLRVICDYISGMTDQYALDQYNQLYES